MRYGIAFPSQTSSEPRPSHFTECHGLRNGNARPRVRLCEPGETPTTALARLRRLAKLCGWKEGSDPVKLSRRLLFLLVACLGLSNAGCLAVAAGCAAGGAAGYAYYQGRIGREFAANPD